MYIASHGDALSLLDVTLTGKTTNTVFKAKFETDIFRAHNVNAKICSGMHLHFSQEQIEARLGPLSNFSTTVPRSCSLSEVTFKVAAQVQINHLLA